MQHPLCYKHLLAMGTLISHNQQVLCNRVCVALVTARYVCRSGTDSPRQVSSSYLSSVNAHFQHGHTITMYLPGKMTVHCCLSAFSHVFENVFNDPLQEESLFCALRQACNQGCPRCRQTIPLPPLKTRLQRRCDVMHRNRGVMEGFT